MRRRSVDESRWVAKTSVMYAISHMWVISNCRRRGVVEEV